MRVAFLLFKKELASLDTCDADDIAKKKNRLSRYWSDCAEKEVADVHGIKK